MENQVLSFNLTVAQANVILQALSEIPFKVAQPLIQELQAQAAPQIEKLQAEQAEAPAEAAAE